MNFIKNVQVFIGVLLLQPFGHYCGHHSNDIIASALQVAIDLYNENHTEHEFLSMIQTLFCPDQPVCNQPDVTESSDALSSDFTTSRGAYQRDIIKSLKHCCLPCSCDDVTCSENDNCCLTKQAISFETAQTPAETTIKTACIAATSRSYFSKHTLENTYSRYSMVTRCFKNRDNATLVTRCEQPGIYDITPDVTIPVFSLTTGRTYWNIYCAVCQNDTQDLVTWDATVYLRRNYFIFSHRSRPVTAANNFSYFYSEVMNAGEVIYTKPSETEPNVCLPKDAIEDVDVTIFHPLCHEHKFLQVACQNFDSPSLINSLRGARAYKNMFCLLCQTGSTLPKKEADCRLDVYRGLPPSYVALLNQKLTVNGSLSGSNSIEPTSQQECPCYTILDSVQVCLPFCFVSD